VNRLGLPFFGSGAGAKTGAGAALGRVGVGTFHGSAFISFFHKQSPPFLLLYCVEISLIYFLVPLENPLY